MAMQMNWIMLRVDVGRMTSEFIAVIVSHEDVLNVMRDAGIIGPYDTDISDLPGLSETILSLGDVVGHEILGFYDRLRVYGLQYFLTGLPIVLPDIFGIVSILPDLLLVEVMRVTENIGELSQDISISDIPNLINLATLTTDTIAREGEAWGINHEIMHEFRLNAGHAQTIEQYISILQAIFAAVALLLIIFIYLVVSEARLAGIFGMFCMVVVLLLSAGFAVAVHVASDMLTDIVGDFVYVSAGWYVYATAALSVLTFVFTALHMKGLRSRAK